ncbi:MAG: M28 family peptidase, partial [Gemmatimonadaceae bacterium]
LCLSTRTAHAQSYPLLDSATSHVLAAEISGDAAYDHVRALSSYHRPQASDTLFVAAQYVERMARAFGLDGVRLITQQSPRAMWNPGTSDLWLVGERPERIASSIQNRVHLADRSRPADVTAELIDIGAGTDGELRGRDVAGKVVLTTGDLNGVMANAVQRRGAAGVVWYPDPYTPSRGYLSFGVDQPTTVPWLSLSTRVIDGKEPTFAFVLSLRQGVALRNRLAASRTPLRVRAVVRSEMGSRVHARGSMPLVEAVIRGSDRGAGQDVVLTAHLQEEQHSANDDASGCASLLEIGRALTRLIAEGRLPRPRRTIRFWWTTENISERTYFAEHPAVLDTLWVAINQDMVGADQAIDVMRTQDVTRLPASRFHFLNDVMEAVVDYMVAANTSNITQYRNGYGLYPKPHLAHNGSQHRYNAQSVWYFGDSDHESFLNVPAGIPAITFTNSPDRYIHTNLDDLFQIDRTQLGRNAASVALIAYTMAAADTGALGAIAAEVVGRGQARLGRNVGLGMRLLATSADRGAAYHTATDQLRYAVERERRAIRSLGEIRPGAERTVAPLLAELERREAQAQREIRAAYARVAGEGEPPPRTHSAVESELAALRLEPAGTPRDFLARRDDVQWTPETNGYLAREILNAIDGTRTGLDLYRHAAAMVREAGTHYYGTVTSEAVLSLLRSAERSGLFRVRR